MNEHTIFVATECSLEERSVISKLFNNVRQTLTSMQRLQQREHESSLAHQSKLRSKNSNSANAEEAIVSVAMTTGAPATPLPAEEE